MTRPKNDALSEPLRSPVETKLDKTTRIVREITEGEAEKRQSKTARLRAARLEQEAKLRAEPVPAKKARRRVGSQTNG